MKRPRYHVLVSSIASGTSADGGAGVCGPPGVDRGRQRAIDAGVKGLLTRASKGY